MLNKIANTVRVLSAEAVEKAGSGHPGMPLGCAEIGAILFGEVMEYCSQEPNWFNRDRLVLSAGHGSIWLYTLLHLAGYNLSLEDLKDYRKFGSITPGHPERGVTPGVEVSTGPLGQGLAHAVGIALGERILAARFNQENASIVDYFTYVVAGDGDLMEGVSYEACSLAGSLGLDKLIVIYDDNEISIDGKTDLTFRDDVHGRFTSMGWQVIQVDGHNVEGLLRAFDQAKNSVGKPTLIQASTTIGKGAFGLEGTSQVHGAPLGQESIKQMKEEFGYSQEPFTVPSEVRDFFTKRQKELAERHKQWKEKFAHWEKTYPELAQEWLESLKLSAPLNLTDFELDYEAGKSTRDYGGQVYRIALTKMKHLIGGSADLSDSTKIYSPDYPPIKAGQYSGRHIHFGVREHAMAAVAAGLVLCGGIKPVVSTYLTFSDYMKPSLRLAGMMKLPVVYVFTHDSIHVGEDGPTHQPIEQLEALRQIPGFRVIRPADGQETLFAWYEALVEKEHPTALILSRQTLPYLKVDLNLETFQKGAYKVKEFSGARQIAIMASGSEVALALQVATKLEADGVGSKVISVPERKKLERNKDYLKQLLGEDSKLIVAIEAGVPSGWYGLVGTDGLVIGLEDFGLSGDGERVASALGLEEEQIYRKIQERLLE